MTRPSHQPAPSGPFAMLVDPEAVQAAVRAGDALALPRHVCRPLDRPAPGSLLGRLHVELSAIDAQIEAEEDAQREATLEAIAVQTLIVESIDVEAPRESFDADEAEETERSPAY